MTPQRDEQIRIRAKAARAASRVLATAPVEARNRALTLAAVLLLQRAEAVLQANAEDCAQAAGLTPAAFARLKVDATKLREMARGLEAVAGLADPLGQVRLRRLLDDGLELTQLTCPLGVLGVIFESRPDALLQIGSLAIKSGNAALLKGGPLQGALAPMKARIESYDYGRALELFPAFEARVDQARQT